MEDQSSQAAPNVDNSLKVLETKKRIEVNKSDISGSRFTMLMMNNALMENICATNLQIRDANLGGLEIEYAQLGGAYIHNIGLPPKGHPLNQEGAKQKPLTFEDCDLNGSTITNCDLSGVNISDCNLDGMKINGILVTDLLKARG